MPKPMMATAQDVQELEAKLKQEIQRVQGLIDPAIAASEGRMKTPISAVNDKVTANEAQTKQDLEKARTEAKNYTNDSCKALHLQILPLFPPIEATIQAQSKAFNSDLSQMNDSLQNTMKTELQALCVKFDEEIANSRSELSERMETWGKEAAEALVKQKEDMDASCKDLRAAIESADNKNREDGKKALDDTIAAQKEAETLYDERNQRAQGEIYVKIGLLDEKLQKAVDDLAAETRETHSSHVNNVGDFQSRTTQQLAILDDDTKALRNAMSECENVSTRKVEWVIKDVSKRIRPLTPSRSMLHTSWFSPRFDAAGAHGMQLEVQLFRNSDPPVDGEDAGDIAIHLWACKGMQLSYKLSCGTKTAPVIEKMFNGRIPYGTKRFWFLQSCINKEDDTLKVSVEILEAIREVEHIVKPPVPPVEDPDAPPKTLEEIRIEEEMKDKALEGSMFFQRWTNNRLHDQVKKQIDIMQSRMVRKIEWRVEQASLLRKCFPPNECLCSATFSAAGIEGMQFVFYPSGYKNATEGYCSLFLYGPAGATLKCWLSAGNQKREASHTFDEPGAFGRTNFCRFESSIDDSEDVIVIHLDIEDAQQDWTALVKHPALQPGDRRNLKQIDGSSDKAIESIVKLTKKPGQRASGKDANLIELKVLPSLWTAKQLGTTTAIPDGMHNFDEVRTRVKGPSTSGGPSRQRSQFSMGSSLMQGSSMVQASSSMPTMPTMHDASMRTALEEDLSPPLPQLSKTYSDGRDFATVRKASDQRRSKKGQNLGASMTAL
jgi:hypothetical protein